MKTTTPIILFALTLLFIASAHALTGWVIPVDGNNTVSNNSATTMTVQITTKSTTANFTILNISRYSAGTANVTVRFFNMSNESAENHSISVDCTSLADGVYHFEAIPHNGSAEVTGTGRQNATLTCDDTTRGVHTVSPITGLADDTRIAFTAEGNGTCRYDLQSKPFEAMSNTFAGNGSVYNLTSPLGSNKEQCFYVTCQDQYQNVNTTQSKWCLTHASKGLGSVALALAIKDNSVSGGVPPGLGNGGLGSIASGILGFLGTFVNGILSIVTGVLS